MTQPIDSALDVLLQLAARSRARVPSPEQLFAIVRDFAGVRFEVPSSPDADGFLFQYGNVNWLDSPTFSVGFVRQLELADASGQHEGFMQIKMEYRYHANSDLSALSSDHSWWFPDDDGSIDEWLHTVERSPVWSVVERRQPTVFEMFRD